MNDHDLDTLLARARAETPADAGAAERFLGGAALRDERARAARARHLRAGWVPALLASAAVVAGVSVLRPPPALPASAAYEAYQSAWGDGW
ncbi:hypothetical protein [Deinococcus aerophilus]|uniref:DUF3619 domain-containing protein n=1 Tax=Deinococcus aerophilus TaxID=522488 RepID=A0ABQ2GVB0_9DEIO|nr:hypothetical protein [Deinococcus aerophilus]GGM13569.1 hypothetical protein GCM10010841_22730 [Deinococcus aerophilus]